MCNYFENKTNQMENVEVRLVYVDTDGEVFGFKYGLHGCGENNVTDIVLFSPTDDEWDDELLEVPCCMTAFDFVDTFVKTINGDCGTEFVLADITTRIVWE